MNRNERRLAKKNAPKVVAAGIDPSDLNPVVMTELTQQIHSRLIHAKQRENIDGVIEYLNSKINLTVSGMSDVPVACSKGCSHCCNIWVSATAPEILYIAKRLSAGAPKRISEANEFTKGFSHEERPHHPHPCPLLESNLCSIYQHRPLFCRLAASGDAAICERSYSNVSDEYIPTPAMYIFGRDAYSTALAVALKAANLQHICYEFNSALNIALTTPDAEKRWLAGEDIFATARTQEDVPPFEENEPFQYLYGLAFKR